MWRQFLIAPSLRWVSILWTTATGVALLVVAFGVALDLPRDILRTQLARWTVYSLSFSFLAMIIFLLLCRTPLKTACAILPRRSYLALGGIMLAGLLLLAFVVPRVNRIYFDEFIYQNIAMNIHSMGRAFIGLEGCFEDGRYVPVETEYNKEPNGYPFFIALLYRLFGMHEWVAYAANNVAYGIGILGVFGTGFLLFRSVAAGLWAAAFYTLTPMVLQWSNTAAIEPSAAAFASLAMAAGALFVRTRMTSALFLAVSVLAFGIQFRPESILIAIPFAALVLTGAKDELAKPRFYGAMLVLLILLLPHILHMYVVRGEEWGSTGSKFSFSVFWNNLRVNGPFYWKNGRYPICFSLLALFGFAWRCPWRPMIPILTWFLAFWGIFLFFYAGSYNYGADVRFSVLSAAPLALLAGCGAARIAGWKTPVLSFHWGRPALWVVLVLALVPFILRLRIIGPEGQAARADIEATRWFIRQLPEHSIVLTHTPCSWLVLGQAAADMGRSVYNKAHVDNDLLPNYPGGVYLHWGFWCNKKNKEQYRLTELIMEKYKFIPFVSTNATGNVYMLYKLIAPR